MTLGDFHNYSGIAKSFTIRKIIRKIKIVSIEFVLPPISYKAESFRKIMGTFCAKLGVKFKDEVCTWYKSEELSMTKLKRDD